MEGWAPLAPTKRTSGLYARADGIGPSSPAKKAFSNATNKVASSSKNVLNGAVSANGTASSATAREPSPEERRAAYIKGPSDPFPPVGPFPRAVAVRILSFLPLSEQKNCALAGRALAKAVADESNWSRRLEALDWCTVDGLHIASMAGDDDGIEAGQRSIGRRRKGKAREVTNGGAKASEYAAHQDMESKMATTSLATATPAKSEPVQKEDDFGDFAAPVPPTEADDFGDFVGFDNIALPVGGSLASGTASVAMGGGRPHQFTSTGAPNLKSTTPAKQQTYHKTTLLPSAKANGSLFSYSTEAALPLSSASPSFRKLRAYAKALRPFLRSLADLSTAPSNSHIFSCDLGLSAQTALLANLLRYISTSVGGGAGHLKSKSKQDHNLHTFEDEESLSYRGQEAAHHLLQSLLSSFQGTLARRDDAFRAAAHGADTARAVRRAEDDMRMHANGVWELGNARLALALSERDEFSGDVEDQFGRMKAAKAFLDQCDILSGGLRKHNPLDNVPERGAGATLDFTAMDAFIADLIETMKKDGQVIASVFPPEQDILLAYADHVAQDVLAAYIQSLLEHTRTVSDHLYLRGCAATFAQSWKLVDVLLAIEPRDKEIVTKNRCEDVVFHMWEGNMADYLKVESHWVREEMQNVTEKWESDVKTETASRVDAAFLNSHNPAAVKRSVLSGFKDVLLLPVTVVPRTAGIVGGAVIRTAGTGLSSLNPRRWQSSNDSAESKGGLNAGLANGNAPGTPSSPLAKTPNETVEKGYMDFSSGAVNSMDSDDDDGSDLGDAFNEKDEWNQEVEAWSAVASSRAVKDAKQANRRSSKRQSALAHTTAASLTAPFSSSRPSTMETKASNTSSRASTPLPGSRASLTQMQLLLSLDTALQVIHVNRDCLKRVETFKAYPHPHGERVKAAIQDISLLLFRALGEGHISPGFEKAMTQIQEWKPEEHDPSGANAVDEKHSNGSEREQQEVEPLVHFFELVHVADTIAQMVQVYFDQEIARHIDKNDFLNPVVKGRKRFEGQLDEAVAKGLNAGVDLLLGQAEHIITSRQDAKDYNPDQGQLADLTPTKACRDAVACLKLHCRMLIGSTDKNILEVFYQEVGIRLHTILTKHLKHQVISLDGGFRVIADLNEYHAFIATLRQPSLTADFDAFKMLGNLYIIDNPKELAKLARDANMFGGALSPEDLYEFLQARADFRTIEKAIDKEMYGFKVSEDCCIC